MFGSHQIRAVLAFVVVLVLASCGGGTAATSDDAGDASAAASIGAASAAPDAGDGDDGNASGGDVDLCAVLTLEEVSEAAGVEVTEATSASVAEVSSCNFNTADGLPVAGNTYTRGNEALDPEQMFEANLGDVGEEIPGLGDRAVLTGDENFPIVMVLKGGALYSISVLADNLDAEGKRQASIDLARLSVDRLP